LSCNIDIVTIFFVLQHHRLRGSASPAASQVAW